MDKNKKRIAIIGSGVTGLTIAYRLQQQVDKEELPVEIIVLESSIRSGGKLYTMKFGEEFIDLGAESIDTRLPEAMELIKELGLKDEIELSQNGKQDVYAFNKLYNFDCPTYKGIPVRRTDIWKLDLISFQGKLDFLRNTYFSGKEANEEITTKEYLAQRIGEEMAEYAAEPYFAKIYTSDIDEIGIHGFNEPIVELEQEYGTWTKVLENHPDMRDRDGMYATFKEGLETLTRELTDKVSGKIRFSKKVTEIKRSINNTYILDINKKEQLRVDSLVVATDPGSYNELFIDIELSDYFKEIKMGSVGFLLLSFPKGSLKNPPKGNGVLSVRRNNSYIQSIVWLNRKWNHFKDKDEELLGIYFGRSVDGVMMSLSNKQIEEEIIQDVSSMLKIDSEPNYKIIKRWPNAIPQFTLTHEEKRKNLFEFLSEKYPGLYLAGNGIKGFGINNCIAQANEVSQQALEHLKKTI
ncbi:protoporphyrinogen oxidase [Alkalibacterium putridalgicola]|uniref:Coproporphyrinogen III oxidase n=1 Tax=Alkalibacterium putridalgicola TaxID=426703 RepID=A0A1H7SYJ4_9LACT|nr:protoporphyrinogen oxidase [Alkalibacterium putridalgicola]GEK89229.1 protoporphyrinogen oxidase [Alkalibacterium putridalgicola]SEL77116.1 oxygen-dependent protoporphyrinogen oxidase [Alkalibacterium putridalgicola]